MSDFVLFCLIPPFAVFGALFLLQHDSRRVVWREAVFSAAFGGLCLLLLLLRRTLYAWELFMVYDYVLQVLGAAALFLCAWLVLRLPFSRSLMGLGFYLPLYGLVTWGLLPNDFEGAEAWFWGFFVTAALVFLLLLMASLNPQQAIRASLLRRLVAPAMCSAALAQLVMMAGFCAVAFSLDSAEAAYDATRDLTHPLMNMLVWKAVGAGAATLCMARRELQLPWPRALAAVAASLFTVWL